MRFEVNVTGKLEEFSRRSKRRGLLTGRDVIQEPAILP